MGKRQDRVLFMTPEVLDDLDDDTRAQLLHRLNSFNPLLGVGRILPFPAGESFSIKDEADSVRFALVAEAREVDHQSSCLAPDEGYADSLDGAATLYSTIVYVLASTSEANGRNVFATQTMFPSLCALIKSVEYAPGAVFSAHPVYFLDMAGGSATESVRRTLLLFIAMGIGYVPVFRDSIEVDEVPRNLGALMDVLGPQSHPFTVDTSNRTLTYTVEEFSPGRLLTADSRPENWRVHGSNEKFYWSTILPVAVVAMHSGWKLDGSQVVSYLQSIQDAHGPSGRAKLSKKFHRMVDIFNYIDKISELNR